MTLREFSEKVETIYRENGSWTDGKDYYVKWQGRMVNVNKDIEKRQYIRKSWGD